MIVKIWTIDLLFNDWIFKRLLDQGGLAAQEARNAEKAAILYESIDSSDIFYCPVPESDRSQMNVVFRHKDHDEAFEKRFISEAKIAAFDGIKGHRSVGGLRASIYNAQTKENIIKFAQYIQKFS